MRRRHLPALFGFWTLTLAAWAEAAPPLRPVPSAKPSAPRDTIEGTVRDGHSRAPVAGARVRISIGDPKAWEPEVGLVEAVTDAQGLFRLERLPRGLHDVGVRARGYARALRKAVPAGGRVDFTLFPGASLAGVVRDTNAAPVAGAVVVLEPEERPSVSARPERTDAHGRFGFFGIDAGTYAVVARHPDLAPSVVRALVVEANGETLADVVLRPGASVTGRLFDSKEQPVAGSVAIQEIDGRPASAALTELLSAQAKSDGAFRIERVPAGRHAFAVLAPRHAPKRVDAEVGARDRTVDLGRLILEAGLAIRGRVRDKSGKPVAGAEVEALPQQPWDGSARASTRSQADGAFHLGGLSPGGYRLIASAEGYGRQELSARAGEEKAQFALVASGSITGTVVDDQGLPLESFEVLAQPTGEEVQNVRLEPFAAADGRFRLDNVATGTYLVHVAASDHAPEARSAVEVPAGGNVDLGRIRLGRGGTLWGTVTDSDGTPVAGAAISAQSPEIEYLVAVSHSEPRSESDASGAFELRGVAAGPVRVVVSHPDYAEGRSPIVDVDPSGPGVEVGIVLVRGGRIEGSARKRDGSPIPGASISIFSTQDVENPHLGSAPVLPDGTFAIDRVPPGRFRVSLMLRSGGNKTYGPMQNAEVREGTTTVVDFTQREILVTGNVRRAGAPAANMRVRLRGQCGTGFPASSGPGLPPESSGPRRLTAVTREDGAFEMLADAPGTCGVQVGSVDGSVALPWKSVEIPDAESVTLELDFPTTTLAGTVVDKQTGQPVAGAVIFAIFSRGPGESSGHATSGADGRFQLDLEEGDYLVNARAQGYVSYVSDDAVSVGTAVGSSELTIALSRGAPLQGRVVGVTGRGVSGVVVTAYAETSTGSESAGAETGVDGAFRFDALPARRHTLIAGSESAGFALAPALMPGRAPVNLSLRPGGRAQLLVHGPDGTPIAGAIHELIQLDGVTVSTHLTSSPTDSEGRTEVVLPAGRVVVRLMKGAWVGTVTLDVPEEGVVQGEVMLADLRE
jgi:hypothetical protein